MGAMILTDPKLAPVFAPKSSGEENDQTVYAERRVEYGRATAATMPFPVAFYWSVYAPDCPGRTFGRKNSVHARGVALSHFQIWADFARGGERIFLAKPNKRGDDDKQNRSVNRSSSDVLVILEDDAEVSVKNLTAVLAVELANMNTDLLYLGWCETRISSFPMCTHAYALTREGARKLVSHFDICSKLPIDLQLEALSKDNIFTLRLAFPQSYTRASDQHRQGIFLQNKKLKSFNRLN
jgi:hypothetical protein